MALSAKPEMKVSATDALGFEHEPAPPKRGGRWALLFSLLVLGGSAGIAWMLYGDQMLAKLDFGGGEVPIIRAEQGPVKVRPEKPGGMNVPNRDKLVYGRMQGEIGAARVERLLPPPEQPLPASALPRARPAATPAPTPLPTSAPSREVGNVAPPPKRNGNGPLRLVAPGQKAPGQQAAAAMAPQQPAPAPQPRTQVQPAPLGAVPSAKTVASAVPPPPAPPAPGPARRSPTQVAAATSPPKTTAPTRTAPASLRPSPNSTAGLTRPGKETFRIQLLAARSPEAAEAEWLRLRRQNVDLLGELALAVTRADLGTRGVFYRLRAGPLTSEANAKALCQRLKQRKLGCLVIRPGR